MSGSFDVAVVGAGIAGSTLAALTATHARVLLIDRDVGGLPGSTGHAPGVVAQLNSVPALTELARRSVGYYSRVPGGFEHIGGLEVALGTGDCAESLAARATLAHARGLAAEVISTDTARALAPDFVRDDATGAIHFPDDGVANARVVAATNHARAKQRGATLVDGDVRTIQKTVQGQYALVLADGRGFTARHVVVCTGAWAGQLLPALDAAAVAVAHPYAYSAKRPPRGPPPGSQQPPWADWTPRAPRTLGGPKFQPFVRFPGQVTYARDHGERDGLGTYAHPPVHVPSTVVAARRSAYAHWKSDFDTHVDHAATVLPDETARGFNSPRIVIPAGASADAVAQVHGHDVSHTFSGLMTMTPDGVPLAGHLGDGLWCLVGTWVTHAAGVASVLAPQILSALNGESPPPDDAWLRAALDPQRFDAMPEAERREHCLDKYRDIWNRKNSCRLTTPRPMRAKL